MDERLIIVDGYNLILRSPHLQPGPGRTLRESRDKLVNLLSWAMGGDAARFLVVFDGARDAPAGGGGGSSGRVQVRFSRPPQTADDLIRELVEEHVERVDRLTVVTADLEVARHARAMGADVSIADLFLAAAIDPGGEDPPEKPATLSRAEIEEWAKLFQSRPRAPGDEDAPN